MISKKNVYLILIFLILLLFYIISCNMNKDNDEYNDDLIEIILEDLISWELDEDGFIKFYTNDDLLLFSEGCSFWKPDYYSNIQNNEFEATINKVSGDSQFGFGIIFCIQDTFDNIDDIIATDYYALLIRTDGFYQINKVVNRKQHPMIIPDCNEEFWALAIDESNDEVLTQGKNQFNNIKIVTNDDDNDNRPEFEIFINNTLILSFEEQFVEYDGEELELFNYDNGLNKYGFIVTIGPEEDFPTTPVDVRFKQITN